MGIELKKNVTILNTVAMVTWVLGGIASFIMIVMGLSDIEDTLFMVWWGLGLAITALIQGALLFALGHILDLLDKINGGCAGFNKIEEENNEELPQL